MMIYPLVAAFFAGTIFFLSRRVLKAPLPQRPWRLFDHPDVQELSDAIGKNLEGIYKINAGSHKFGGYAVAQWKTIVENGTPKKRLSLLFEKHAAYMICDARQLRNKILLKGYWSMPDSAQTGEVRLVIGRFRGGYKLVHNLAFSRLVIDGWWGKEAAVIGRRLKMRYKHPLPDHQGFHILAHRGCGRNTDFYPYSENSLESIRLGYLLGATGLEIDISMSKDGVPVVFHDPVLSYRTIDNYFLVTPVNNYTVDELKAFKLKKGEQVPTLEEAMHTVLMETSLQLVWWDIKYIGDLTPLLEIYHRYTKMAAEMGRKLEIFFGLAESGVVEKFKQLTDYKDLHSLTELDALTAMSLNSRIWAPKWTERVTEEQVNQFKQAHRSVFTWTVDLHKTLRHFVACNMYDGILTNVPSALAYYYFTRDLNHRSE